VPHDQPGGVRGPDGRVEGRDDRPERAEEEESHRNREHGEERPPLRPHQIREDQPNVLKVWDSFEMERQVAAFRGVRIVVTMMMVFPSPSSAAEEDEDLLGVSRVQVARRLVRHEERRIRHDRAGDRDALLFAAGELSPFAPSRPTRASARRTRFFRSAALSRVSNRKFHVRAPESG
jgi:hypothetical protein